MVKHAYAEVPSRSFAFVLLSPKLITTIFIA